MLRLVDRDLDLLRAACLRLEQSADLLDALAGRNPDRALQHAVTAEAHTLRAAAARLHAAAFNLTTRNGGYGGGEMPLTSSIYDGLKLDPAAMTVTFRDQPVHFQGRERLPRKMFDLLAALLRDPDRVWRKEELLRHVWGPAYTSTGTRTLESHACKLRTALADAGAEGWVVARWGVGYRLAPAPVERAGVVTPFRQAVGSA